MMFATTALNVIVDDDKDWEDILREWTAIEEMLQEVISTFMNFAFVLMGL